MTIDLSSIPIFDHHAHALRRQPPTIQSEWLEFFTEGRDDHLLQNHAPNLLFYRYAINTLAEYLGCPATPESIFHERNQMGEKEWIRRMVRDANITIMLIDYGFRGPENYNHQEMQALLPCRLEPILRLETLAQELIMKVDTLSDLMDAFSADIEDARRVGYVALKSIIAYRTGLDIHNWQRADVESTFQEVKESARREGIIRLAHAPINDTLVLRALEIANREEMPFQFHCGFGDNDVDLRLANPLHFRPLLHSNRFINVPWVILHMGYPFVRESAYLTSVYRNVYVDLSLAIPFAISEATSLLSQIFGLAPLSKVLYASDGFSVPELFWLGAKAGRSGLAKVFNQMITDKVITPAEAITLAEQIFCHNASQLYGIPMKN
ncbi:MAG: amidohydrolase family protein [Chloroflexota bacterium]